MNITYTGRKFDITDRMKDYIEKRLTKIKFYFPEIITVNIIGELQRGQYTFEIKISANHETYFAKDTASNWNQVVDSVTDKIEKEVKRKKDKIKTHH